MAWDPGSILHLPSKWAWNSVCGARAFRLIRWHMFGFLTGAMSSPNAPISLADYRLDKEDRRLKRRLANAQTIFNSTGKYEIMLRLKYLAILDYLEDVPELRELGRQQKNKLINRTLIDDERTNFG